MDIDIIDLTLPEYADLSPVQLAMVRAAQAKKNKILAKAAKDQNDLFFFTVSNNTARSSAYKQEYSAIAKAAEAEIETVKADLLYQIAYEGIGQEGNDNGPYRYPENPNYNLSYSQRFLVVRNYYMDATDDPEARLRAFAMDSLAREYLGEYYQTLYELLASYC